MTSTLDEPLTSDVAHRSADEPMVPRPRRRRWGRLLVGVLVVAVLAAGAWAVAAWRLDRWPFDGDADQADVAATVTRQVVSVGEGTLTDTVSAESTVEAAHTESLSFSASGTVSAVFVEVGDTVSAGQVVARLDSASLRADVADAQASVTELEAQIHNYSVELWEYREDNEDDPDEYDEGDKLADQIASSEARLAVANDNLADAEHALDGAVLTATIDGSVTAIDINEGEELGSDGSGGTTLTGSETGSGASSSTLGAGGSVLPGAATSSSDNSGAQVEIVSAGLYKVELSLDSADIEGVEVGQQVTISEATSSSTGFPGLPGGFPGGGLPGGVGGFPGGGFPGGEDGEAVGPEAVADGASTTGTVVEVSDIADASSGVATYSVVVEFTDEAGDFYIGTTVIAEITVSERSGAVLVASNAVTTQGGQSTVEVALDGTAGGPTETRLVTTGESSGTQIEITSGLQAGEQVIVEFSGGPGGNFQLPDGFGEGGFPGGFQPPEGFGEGGFPGDSIGGSNP